MSSLPSRRIGFILVPLGVVLLPLTIFTGSGTLGACPESAPDFLGIDFSQARILDLQVATMSLSWYDGCNWRSSWLVPSVLGFVLIAIGLVLIGRSMNQQHTDTV
ncbi:hypothetical protein SAMN05421858_4597 [Haladaptatus litoreus]|uniref:Transmembrane protein n=1 Tax=Haladaptatus litoreus TaxID=553468 RepID=A0A1N7EX34_9EURY|nr:hypothetical protein SAMN05421858_4597 [Haladaptatus litoreus]